jgi:hypothetical protein
LVHVHLGAGGVGARDYLCAGEVRARANHGAGVGGALGGIRAGVYSAGVHAGAVVTWRIGVLVVIVSFATGPPDLIELGLAAAAYLYGAAVYLAFNNAAFISNYEIYNGDKSHPPTDKTTARTVYIRLYRGAYPFEEPIHERYLFIWFLGIYSHVTSLFLLF